MKEKVSLGRRAAPVFALLFLFSGLAVADDVPLTAAGDVKSVSQKARILMVNLEGKAVNFRFDDSTAFKNAQTISDVSPGEKVTIEYKETGPDRIASVITRDIVKLPEGISEIKTEELEGLLKKGPETGNFLLVDSRPKGKYDEGHIPGAVSIPVPVLEKEGAKVLPSDRDKEVIVYCGGPTCGLSPKFASLAKKLGHTRVSVYIAGEPGWKKVGHYTVSSLDFVKTANIVLLDLRSPQVARKGYIPKAVNLPVDSLSEQEDQFPSYKGASVVAYSDREEDILKAVGIIREWGYKKVTALAGGTEAWKAAGNTLLTGEPPTNITYARVYGPGEIAIPDFEKALADGSALIVDVRTQEEFAKEAEKGHFKGAINVPADEMVAKYASLPKDRPIITHCSTGVRAEMAYSVLKEKGYDVRMLNASVEFDPDGGYVISD